MTLTSNNYYSQEANVEYMSASQFKAFERCPAAAMAELRGEYTRPKTTALLVGSYVDAYFEGTLDQFKDEHPEILKRDGTLKADYQQADKIIERCERDDLFMLLMSGEKQVIKTGTINGVPYKIKMDSLLNGEQAEQIARKYPETRDQLGLLDGVIVDLKVMRDMAPQWYLGSKVPFYEAWGYDIQGAIYQAIEGNDLPVVLAVATKEQETDLGAIAIPDVKLQDALERVKNYSPLYQAIKEHKAPATRCEKCDYCKRTKRLTRFTEDWELEDY